MLTDPRQRPVAVVCWVCGEPMITEQWTAEKYRRIRPRHPECEREYMEHYDAYSDKYEDIRD